MDGIGQRARVKPQGKSENQWTCLVSLCSALTYLRPCPGTH